MGDPVFVNDWCTTCKAYTPWVVLTLASVCEICQKGYRRT